VLALTFAVIAAVSGGDAYESSFAAGIGIALGVVAGAFLGCLVFFLRYALR
jgi:hypothetical protein